MIISCDWNDEYSSLTESHALKKAYAYLPESQHIIYVGFPWSNLFDAIDSLEPHLHLLMEDLEKMKEEIPPACRIVTVCEHVNLPAHIPLLKKNGITDIFWSHIKTSDSFLSDHEISIHPFPILPKDTSDTVLRDRNFGLCITDKGFDLALLWQCIHQEIIPIVSENSNLLPGNLDLWNQATMLCNKEEIAFYGAEPQAPIHDDQKISDKKNALKQLRLCYGKDFFITDIVQFFFNPSNRVALANEKTQKHPRIIDSSSQIYFLSFISNLIFDPTKMSHYFFTNYFFQRKLLHEFNKLDNDKKSVYRKIMAHYGVDIG